MVKSCFIYLVFHPKNSTCPFSCPGWSPSTSKCTEQFLATAAKWSAKVVRQLNSLFQSNSSWWYEYGYSAPLYQHVHHLVPTQAEINVTTYQRSVQVGKSPPGLLKRRVFFFFCWLIKMSGLELRTPAASVTSTAAMAFRARPSSPVWISGLHFARFSSHTYGQKDAKKTPKVRKFKMGW